MSELGYTSDLSSLSEYIPNLVYDSGSNGGTAGDTGHPSSSFGSTALNDFLSAGAHDLASWVAGLGHSATPTSSAYANSGAYPPPPPPSSSDGMEPVVVTPAQHLPADPPASTFFNMADLTDFTKPTPYVAFFGVLLLVKVLGQGGR